MGAESFVDRSGMGELLADRSVWTAPAFVSIFLRLFRMPVQIQLVECVRRYMPPRPVDAYAIGVIGRDPMQTAYHKRPLPATRRRAAGRQRSGVFLEARYRNKRADAPRERN